MPKTHKAISGLRGGGGVRGFNPAPPRTWKNCCRKMMVFPKALFLATTFRKNRYKFNFSIAFSSKIFKSFSKISLPIVFFVQTRKNLTHSFEIFWKIGKNNAFLQFSYEFFANFRKFSGVRGAPPPDPLRGRPYPWTPRTPLKAMLIGWFKSPVD